MYNFYILNNHYASSTWSIYTPEYGFVSQMMSFYRGADVDTTLPLDEEKSWSPWARYFIIWEHFTNNEPRDINERVER